MVDVGGFATRVGAATADATLVLFGRGMARIGRREEKATNSRCAQLSERESKNVGAIRGGGCGRV